MALLPSRDKLFSNTKRQTLILKILIEVTVRYTITFDYVLLSYTETFSDN